MIIIGSHCCQHNGSRLKVSKDEQNAKTFEAIVESEGSQTDDNALKPMAAKTFCNYLIGHEQKYNLEQTNNVSNASDRRVRRFWVIEALVVQENRK